MAFFGDDHTRSQRSDLLFRKAPAKKQLKRIDRHPPTHRACGSDTYHAGNNGGRDLCIFLVESLQNIDRIEIQTWFVGRCEFFDLYLTLSGRPSLPDIDN